MDAVYKWMVSVTSQQIYFSACIGLPSSALYALQVVTIVRCSDLHNPFYAFFFVRASVDLLYQFTSYSAYRVPSIFALAVYPFYAALPEFLVALPTFLTSYTFQANNLATIWILLNRMTAIALPFRHQTLWRKMLWPAVLTIYGFPLVLCFNVLFIHSRVDKTNTTFTIVNGADNYTAATLNTLLQVNSYTSWLYLVICVALNLVAFIAFRRSKKRVQLSREDDEADQVNRKLLIYAVVTFLGHILFSVLRTLTWLLVWTQQFAALAALFTNFWICDTGTVVISSWLLLWASTTFRERFLADYVPKCVLLMRTGAPTTFVQHSRSVQVAPAPRRFLINGTNRGNGPN